MFSRLKFSVASHPLVQVIISAFLGAGYTVVEPAVRKEGLNALTFSLDKAAIAAGILAVGRTLVLLFPAKQQ